MVREFNWKFSVAEPSVRSSVPLTGEENVFSTHTDKPAFEIGSGVPKRQPVFVQSNPAPAAAIGPTVQWPSAVQLRLKRFVDPAGVVLSGTCERPPPSERFPQMSFFSGIVPARSRKVLPHVPEPAVDRKSNAVAGWNVMGGIELVVVVVGPRDVLDVVGTMDVLDVVGMVEELDVVGTVDELDVVGTIEEVVGAIDELVLVLDVVDATVPDVDVEEVVWTVDELVVLAIWLELVELVVGTVDVLDVVPPTQTHCTQVWPC
jgi:hypothetical protein